MPTQTGHCPKCRALNAYTATTCIECGSWLPWANVAAAAQRQQATPQVVLQNSTPTPYPVAPPIQPQSFAKTEQTSLAVASMVLGIIGLVFFWVWFIALPCYVLAFVLGIVAIRQQQGGRGMAIAGLTMGSIGLVICLIGVIFVGMLAATFRGAATANQEAIKQMKVADLSARVTDTGSTFSKANTVLVTGNVTNPSTSMQKIILDVQIFNSSNVMVATRPYYEMVQGGETKLFAVEVRDTTQSQPFTYKVSVRAR